VFDVAYTPTADFVLTASEDGNVRYVSLSTIEGARLTSSIWKSNASKKIGPISTKERQSIEYRQKLVEKWSTSKDVRSVAERRFVPASIHNTTKLKRDMIEAQKVKEDRRRSHTRAGKEKPKAERKSESFLVLLRCLADDVQRLLSRSRNRVHDVGLLWGHQAISLVLVSFSRF
jgi:WD repeat and SOF domain-containing protein 1